MSNSDLIKIDGTMLTDFLNCRELFRRKWILNQVPQKPAIHLEFGKLVHRGAELYWRGSTYQECFDIVMQEALQLNQALLNPQELSRWNELTESLPDCLAAYYDYADRLSCEPPSQVEIEWSEKYNDSTTLCGRIDRLQNNVLYDLKTASAVGKTWKRDLKNYYCRNIGLALYDWYAKPKEIAIEVLVKPWKAAKPYVETVSMPEIIAARPRFEQQLSWLVPELVHCVKSYSSTAPWPMNGGFICVGKHGPCDYLEPCLYGDNARTDDLFKPREEHLSQRKCIISCDSVTKAGI